MQPLKQLGGNSASDPRGKDFRLGKLESGAVTIELALESFSQWFCPATAAALWLSATDQIHDGGYPKSVMRRDAGVGGG